MLNVTRMFCVLAVAAAVLAAAVPASAQLTKDSVVVGLSSSPTIAGTTSAATDTFRVYSGGVWSHGPTPTWNPWYIQSIEFDNAGMISHNARGNLFGVDFGSGYYGFEIYNLATDGTNNSSLTWSIVAAQGGTPGTNPATVGGNWKSERGGGLSVSPNNSYVAWVDTDSACVFVHNYLPGSNPGSGLAGPMISGARQTPRGSVGDGVTFPCATVGTCWLNDWTVICLDATGNMEKLDLRNHAVGGTENGTVPGWLPEQISWTDFAIVNSDVWNYESSTNGGFTPQTMDVKYNAEINPNLIVGVVTRKGSYTCTFYPFSYDPATGAISLITSKILNVPVVGGYTQFEAREIAFDSHGNLLFSCYNAGSGTYLVGQLVGASNLDNWTTTNLQSFYQENFLDAYNGMDVGASIAMAQKLGDANNDGHVNVGDLQVLVVHWNDGRRFHAFWEGDFNRDGYVNVGDLQILVVNWGK